MNENEKPLSDFILSPSQWDRTTKWLVAVNILFLLLILAGLALVVGGLAGWTMPWLDQIVES